jgi:hypothetical protein
MKIKLEFTEQEINLLLKGLGELKAIESFEIICKIKNYAEEQIINKSKEVE